MFLQGGVNMQVFKTFMKILKTRLTSALLYLVIFMVIAVIMADTAKDNNEDVYNTALMMMLPSKNGLI